MSPSDPLLQYRLFGGPTVLRDGEPVDLGGRKQRAVLAVLVLHAGAPVPVDVLVDHVWNGDGPPRAEVSLQAYVSKLRRALEPDHRAGGNYTVLVTEPGAYRLVAERSAVDLTRFDDLRAAAAAALAGGDPATAAARYDAALALHGPLLPGLGGEPWVMEAAARVEAGHADALDGAFEAKLALGQARELIGPLEAAVAAHPFRERLRGHLALALYRAGRQTDALRALAEARRTLADEIGVEPGPHLRRLESDILAHAPHLASPVPPAVPPAPAAAGGPQPAGPAVAPPAAPPGEHPAGPVGLIGRARELDVLLDAARSAGAGEGRAVVVGGEAGIGKTRLVEELVAALAPGDHVVAWARCQESASSAPFWVYRQVAEQLVEAEAIGAAARDGVSSAGGGVGAIDPAADRLALHSAMVAALRSTVRPLAIVVDDLQWADASSLRMLEFIAGALPSLPVVLLATVRPTGPDAPPPLVACLAELARQPGFRRVELSGLTPTDVATWLDRRGETDAGDEVARFVHARTGGNPFFVGELVELLAQQDRLSDVSAAERASVPAAALDVVRRRVGMLPGEAQHLLAMASILGVTIELDLLARMAGLPVADALDALDPAVEAGLLIEDRGGPGRLRFAHALVADALAAELSLARRARLHVAVVEAIEVLRAATLDDYLAALVHHTREGVLAGAAPRAFDYARRAARAADDRAAFEVAASYWAEASALVDLARPGDRRARFEVLVELGQARRRADDVGGSQEVLLDAISVGEAMGDPAAVRRAAGALAATTLWQPSPYGEVNRPLIEALERVLSGLDDTPTAERAALLGALADAVYYERDPARSFALSAAAVDDARRIGDPVTLARALSQRFRAVWRNTHGPELHEVADEMVDLSERGLVGPGLGALAHLARAIMAFQRSDHPTFEADLVLARRLADRSGLPALISQVGWAEVSWLLAQGRYDEATERARDAHLLYRRTRGWDADDILGAFAVAIAHDRGLLDAVLDDMLPLVEGRYGLAGRELLASMLVEAGRPDRARSLVGPEGTVPDAPRDWLWFETTTAAAHARAGLADRVACAVLRERLSPHAGRLDLSSGPFLGGVDLALAGLCEVVGDRAAAHRHAATAVALLERAGTRPALARALLRQGRLLTGEAGESERRRGAAALARARALAGELGLAPVLAALDGTRVGPAPGA